jgi:cobalt-zinc-cadmium resistance protein CzcA
MKFRKQTFTRNFKVYYQIVFYKIKKIIFYLDSLYQNFSKASDRRFELGETNYLEKITAQAKFRQIKTKLSKLGMIEAHYDLLHSLIQKDEKIVISNNSLTPYYL